MQFKDYLTTFPSIDHLSGLEIKNNQGDVIHTIPAIEGKLGSLKLYYALFTQFGKNLTTDAAQQGVVWFAEHVEDAKQHPGKHPNIDLLLSIIEQNSTLELNPIEK